MICLLSNLNWGTNPIKTSFQSNLPFHNKSRYTIYAGNTPRKTNDCSEWKGESLQVWIFPAPCPHRLCFDFLPTLLLVIPRETTNSSSLGLPVGGELSAWQDWRCLELLGKTSFPLVSLVRRAWLASGGLLAGKPKLCRHCLQKVRPERKTHKTHHFWKQKLKDVLAGVTQTPSTSHKLLGCFSCLFETPKVC